MGCDLVMADMSLAVVLGHVTVESGDDAADELLLAGGDLGEDVDAHDHGGSIGEGEVGHGPRDSAYLGSDLGQDLVADAAEALACHDGLGEHHLDRHSLLVVAELLDLGVEGGTVLLARQDADDQIHRRVQQLVQFATPLFETSALHTDHPGRLALLAEGLHRLLECL